MNATEAERIVNAYGEALARTDDPGYFIVVPQSWLQHSREDIKTAIRTFIDHGPPSARDTLISGYSQLGSFVPDEDAVIAATLRPAVRGAHNSKPIDSTDRALQILEQSNLESQRLLDEIQSYANQGR
jgi:hypothetical protein